MDLTPAGATRAGLETPGPPWKSKPREAAMEAEVSAAELAVDKIGDPILQALLELGRTLDRKSVV